MISLNERKRIAKDIQQYEKDTGKSFRTAHRSKDGLYAPEICLCDIENPPRPKEKDLFGSLEEA